MADPIYRDAPTPDLFALLAYQNAAWLLLWLTALEMPAAWRRELRILAGD